jgi:hypothetical protein
MTNQQQETNVGRLINAQDRFAGPQAGPAVVDGTLAPRLQPALADRPADQAEPARTVLRPDSILIPRSGGMVERYKGKPLCAAEAGKLRYGASVAGHGVLRAVPAVWDRFWDWAKLAPLREGGSHRGPVIERHQQAYVTHQRERTRRLGNAAKAATTPWHTSAKVGRVPVAAVTWGVTAGEVSTVAYPTNALLTHTIGALNGWIADLAGALGGAASPLALPVAGVAGAAAVWQGIKAEHHKRRRELEKRNGAEVGVKEDGELLPAIPLADAAHPPAVLEAVRRNLAIERNLVKPLAATPTPWGWEVTVQLKKGRPGDIAGKTAELETLLDVAENGVLVQPHRQRRAQVTLRLIEADPWADLPDAPDYLSARRSITDAIWLGQRLDGVPIVSSFLGKQSIILAASGGGKSILLRLVVDGLAACDDVVLWDLDPSGVGQAPQAAVMAKTALTPDDCETALAQALAIASARTRMLRRLKMGDSWVPSREHPALAIVLDEFPRLTEAGKKMAVALLRIARKAGVVLIFATQDATKGTIGDAIAGQVAFKAGGPGLQDWQSDLLFGVASKASGWAPGRYKPATSADAVNDAGVFFFNGTSTAGGDTALPSKTGYMSGRTAETRAAGYVAAGRLSALDAETLQRAGLTAEQVNTHTDDDAADEAAEQAATTEVTVDQQHQLSPEAQALITAAAQVYADVDEQWISTKAIVAEIAVGELGWSFASERAGEMKVAELLTEAGVAKGREATTGSEGKKVSAWLRPGLLVAAGVDLQAS